MKTTTSSHQVLDGNRCGVVLDAQHMSATSSPSQNTISNVMSFLGSQGKGKAKKRGDSRYYQQLSAKAHRAKKRAARQRRLTTGSCFVKMFKPRFADKVQRGEKLQTVRPTPKRMPKIGDTLLLRTWTGRPYWSKQKQLGIGTVTKVQKVQLIPLVGRLVLDNVVCTHASATLFARADGFRDLDDLCAWFCEEYGSGEFVGIATHWRLTHGKN